MSTNNKQPGLVRLTCEYDNGTVVSIEGENARDFQRLLSMAIGMHDNNAQRGFCTHLEWKPAPPANQQ